MCRNALRARRQETGLSLIELLVVVVILGILAGVVVFAVRGSDDKGLSHAIATDERIIRTAEELYCARNGQYASEQQLVEERFLSEYSKYHHVAAGKDPPIGPGPCNGWNFVLERTEPEGDPTTPPRLPICPEPGGSCRASRPLTPLGSISDFSDMVQLANGKVFAEGFLEGVVNAPTQIFDPAVGNEGIWTPGPSAPHAGIGTSIGTTWIGEMVLLEGNHCAPNCGRVLTHVAGHPGRWVLYDPASNDWLPTTNASFTRNVYARAAQIRGTPAQCGENCGKVLVVGQGYEGAQSSETPPVAELYDPTSNEFTVVGRYSEEAKPLPDPVLAPLSDGRVLLVGGTNKKPDRYAPRSAKLFDAKTATFSDAEVPKYDHWGGWNDPVVFDDDTVLVGHGGWDVPWQAPPEPYEIYRPGPPGDRGTWADVPSCGTAGCYILASLPGGRVLAHGNAKGYPGQTQSVDLFIFSARSRTWTRTGSLNETTSTGSGAVLRHGPCGAHCGKVLVAETTAELYRVP